MNQSTWLNMPRIKHIVITPLTRKDSIESFQPTIDSILRQSNKKFLWLWLVQPPMLYLEMKEHAASAVCCRGPSVKVISGVDQMFCGPTVAEHLSAGEWVITTALPASSSIKDVHTIRDIQKIVSQSFDKGPILSIQSTLGSLLEMPNETGIPKTVYGVDGPTVEIGQPIDGPPKVAIFSPKPTAHKRRKSRQLIRPLLKWASCMKRRWAELRSGKVVVYTAIFGKKDVLLDPEVVEPGVEYICYSDQPQKSKVWRCIVSEPTNPDPCRAAKIFKIMPQLFPELKGKDTIWTDANLQLCKSITPLFEEMDEDIGFFNHPYELQCCIYREARACQKKDYDNRKLIRDTVIRYRDEGHPSNWGLPMGRFILRRQTDQIIEFNEKWWEEISRGSRRDQLSLPVILRRMALPFHMFDPASFSSFSVFRNISEVEFNNKEEFFVRIFRHKW